MLSAVYISRLTIPEFGITLFTSLSSINVARLIGAGISVNGKDWVTEENLIAAINRLAVVENDPSIQAITEEEFLSLPVPPPSPELN